MQPHWPRRTQVTPAWPPQSPECRCCRAAGRSMGSPDTPAHWEQEASASALRALSHARGAKERGHGPSPPSPRERKRWVAKSSWGEIFTFSSSSDTLNKEKSSFRLTGALRPVGRLLAALSPGPWVSRGQLRHLQPSRQHNQTRGTSPAPPPQPWRPHLWHCSQSNAGAQARQWPTF